MSGARGKGTPMTNRTRGRDRHDASRLVSLLVGMGLLLGGGWSGCGVALADDAAALTGTLAYGKGGLVRLVVDRPRLSGTDPRLRLELVNEGAEDFRTEERDAWSVVMSDGRKVALAPRTSMLATDPNFRYKGEDEPFRRAVIKPFESLRLMLAPPGALEGHVASLELRSHELEASLVAADTYRRPRQRLATPLIIPADFKTPDEGTFASLAVLVDPAGRPETIVALPASGSETASGRKDFTALLKTAVAGWTFDPAIRSGLPERSLLGVSVGYSSHRVVRRVFALPEATLAPSLAAQLRATFPFFVEIPSVHGFAVAGPLPEGEKQTIGARAWFIRTGETSGKTWVAVASRTLTGRDPENGMKCGCYLVSDQEDASAGIMDAITKGMGLVPLESVILMPTDGLIPSGLPETVERATWEHDAVHKLLRAALVRSHEVRKSRARPKQKKLELGRPVASADLPEAAAFPYRKKDVLMGPGVLDDDITPPTLDRKVTPDYPEPARRARIEGTVVLQARIDEEGNVRDLEILRGLRGVNMSSIDAVACWKYSPARIDGKPVAVYFTVVISYDLR